MQAKQSPFFVEHASKEDRQKKKVSLRRLPGVPVLMFQNLILFRTRVMYLTTLKKAYSLDGCYGTL